MPEQTKATLTWNESLQFEARSGSGHSLTVGSPAHPGHQGAGPMELLLIAVAGCTAIDIVLILGKMHEPLAALEVSIAGERSEKHPKYYTAIDMVYRVSGAGLSREKVERAVELSHSTYCSALASLRPDCRITTHIEIVAIP